MAVLALSMFSTCSMGGGGKGKLFISVGVISPVEVGPVATASCGGGGKGS